MGNYVDRVLKEKGFRVEQHLNEWNNAHSAEGRGTAYASAHAAAMMLGMHTTNTDMLCYYDSRIGPSVYGGMFNPITYQPFCLYYSFMAFGKLYALKQQAECIAEEKDIFALAATDGETKAVMLTNLGPDQELKTNLEGFTAYLVDEEHNLEEIELDSTCFTIQENQVLYLEKK